MSLIDFLTRICNTIGQTGEWSSAWTTSLVITLPKKGNIQLCQNYRTISLISNASKVMLKVILNRLKPQAVNIIAEEQAAFRVGRSTTEQIFNLRVLCEKYQQNQRDIYHIFIDFKKAFDRVWHAALWATMRRYNITADVIRVVQSLYEKATSQCSTHKRYTGGLVPRHHRRQAGMYLVAYPVQHISRGNYDRCPRKTPWHSQHRRKNHH